MKKFILLLIVALVALVIGFVVGRHEANARSEERLARVIAVSWGDGKYGPAFYGAYVFLEPLDNEFTVKARVAIGRGDGYFHDCVALGVVKTEAEAVARWGKIDWHPDGLHIGNGAHQYFLPRAELESHR